MKITEDISMLNALFSINLRSWWGWC